MVEPSIVPNERLLRALAEQLKLPLMQIARHAELALLGHDLDTIPVIADVAFSAIQLVDSFLLSNDLHAQEAFHLEPIGVSSILFDTAEQLDRLTKHYGISLEVQLSGKYEPVMAHRPSLVAALTTLGYSFLETNQNNINQPIVLGAHRARGGIVTGLFGLNTNLTADMFRRARALYGTSRQPLPTTIPSAGAGLFVADSLLNLMSTELRVARHRSLTGLAATLLTSRQLQLVG